MLLPGQWRRTRVENAEVSQIRIRRGFLSQASRTRKGAQATADLLVGTVFPFSWVNLTFASMNHSRRRSQSPIIEDLHQASGQGNCALGS